MRSISRGQRRRRSLGQHYLTDRSVVAGMVELAGIERKHRVVEVGTGEGVLTAVLAKHTKHLEAFEVDPENYLATRDLGLGVALHLEDAFAKARSFDILVSSLPYSESSRFVEWLSGHRYERAVVLLQKDFVDKLLAAPGGDYYRAITVISQLSSEVRREFLVPRESFDPQPRVTSMVVVMRPRSVLSQREVGLVKMLFSQRRRRLGAALRQLGLPTGRIDPALLSRRVQELTASDFRAVLTGTVDA
jgi:16S rRNA (adenine1518-N6/adenine1519-N6)-dimethyltransferase